MTVGSGVVAALLAPLLEAAGFLEWDIHWKKGGGSAFALNLYKCNLAAIGFLFMTSLCNNHAYIAYASTWIRDSFDPIGQSPMGHLDGVGSMGGIYEQGRRQYMNDRIVEDDDPEEFAAVADAASQRRARRNHQTTAGRLAELSENAPLSPGEHQLIQPPPPPGNYLFHQDILQPNDQQLSLFQTAHQSPPMQQEQIQGNHQGRHRRRLQHSDGMSIQAQPMGIGDGQMVEQKIAQHFEPQQLLEEINRLQAFQKQQPPPPPKIYPLPDAYSKARPPKFTRENVMPLIISSLLGILIGDCAELEALRLIGARRVLIVDTIKPFSAAILGSLILEEPLRPAAFLGMMLTAYGVYVVLMDSVSRLERAKERRLKETRSYKRSGSAGSLLSTGSSGTGEKASSPTVMVVGMRRGSISRHDFFSEFDDALAEFSGDDDLGLFLEDGRNTFCGQVPGRLGTRRRRPSSFGSTGSLGTWTNGSLGSNDGFGFEDDEEDYYFNQDSSRGQWDHQTHGEKAQVVADQTMVVKMSLRLKATELNALNPPPQISPPSPPRTKSALRKSRYSVSMHNSVEVNKRINEGEEDLVTHCEQKRGPVLTPALPASSPRPKSKLSVLPLTQQDTSTPAAHFEKKLINSIGVSIQDPKDKMQEQRPIISVSSSSGISVGSMSTFGTECGPPPGWYPPSETESKTARQVRLKIGYSLATLNVLLDTYAAMITKEHGVGMTTWEINLIRMGFAGLAMLAISIIMRLKDLIAQKYRRLFQKTQNFGEDQACHKQEEIVKNIFVWYKMPTMLIRPWVIVSIGVLFVTFLSPALASYALFEITLALAITLGSVTPLFTLPLGWLLKGERPTPHSFLGASVSVLGVIVLCIWGIDAEA